MSNHNYISHLENHNKHYHNEGSVNPCHLKKKKKKGGGLFKPESPMKSLFSGIPKNFQEIRLQPICNLLATWIIAFQYRNLRQKETCLISAPFYLK